MRIICIAFLMMLVSCGIEYETEHSTMEVKLQDGNDESAVMSFAFQLFKNEMNQNLFILEFNPQNDRREGFALTQSPQGLPNYPEQLSPKLWEQKMVIIGKSINEYARANRIDFSRLDEDILFDIVVDLRTKGMLSHDEDLFDRLLSDRIFIDGNAVPKFDRVHYVRRNYIAVIAAIQWHLQAVRIQEYPGWNGVRGGTTIHDNYFIPRMYAKYIAFENKLDIDFNRDIDHIYKELSEKLKAGSSPNTFAYSRQNASSHLRQKDLSNVLRFGIDMRFLQDGNSIPILPNKGRHLHVGYFEFDDNPKGFTFFKEESYGFGSAADKIVHIKNYFKHLIKNKARKGPRETSTPKAFIDEMLAELESEGYKNEKLFAQLRNANSKKYSLNALLRRLVKDISEYQESDIFKAKVSEKFDVIDVIGSEYILTDDKIAMPLRSETLRKPLASKTSFSPSASRVKSPQSYRIKWPTVSRFRL